MEAIKLSTVEAIKFYSQLKKGLIHSNNIEVYELNQKWNFKKISLKGRNL